MTLSIETVTLLERTLWATVALTPILIGLVTTIAGLTTLALALSSSIVLVGIGLGLAGAGAAMCLTPITSVAMSAVNPERAGMAAGIMSAQRAIGSTVGFAVLGSVLAAWLASPANPLARASTTREIPRAAPNPATRDTAPTAAVAG